MNKQENKESILKLFQNDVHYQLSRRYDGIIIDSRYINYMNHNNILSLGHIINHPPKYYKPNCMICMINYTNEMFHLINNKFIKYIPNTYAYPPDKYDLYKIL